VDYVFRRLALDYLSEEKRETLGIRSIEERTISAKLEAEEKAQPTLTPPTEGAPELLPLNERQSGKALDAPLCYQCGSKMQPAGSCYVCGTCGSTSGCS
jgi:ribonucleoside-diphosphate reductase alpha chain